MSNRPPLNDRQLSLLRFIGESSDETVVVASESAKSGLALRDRGLVVLKKRGGFRTAMITDAGRFYLGHGRYQSSTPRPSSLPFGHRYPRLAAEEVADRVRQADGYLVFIDKTQLHESLIFLIGADPGLSHLTKGHRAGSQALGGRRSRTSAFGASRTLCSQNHALSPTFLSLTSFSPVFLSLSKCLDSTPLRGRPLLDRCSSATSLASPRCRVRSRIAGSDA